MRILVTGANGQVGWELSRSLLPLGEVIALDRNQADLSKPESLVPIVRALKPQIVVNAAAYTAVDRAESEEELAILVNSRSVEVLAEESHRLGALLIHYSTDYVFDGSKASPYSEDDSVNPLNAYGRSKLLGEQAIRNCGGDWLILRTSWVYAERGKNFVRTILRLAAEREELKIVGDQTGSPHSLRMRLHTSLGWQSRNGVRQDSILESSISPVAGSQPGTAWRLPSWRHIESWPGKIV